MLRRVQELLIGKPDGCCACLQGSGSGGTQESASPNGAMLALLGSCIRCPSSSCGQSAALAATRCVLWPVYLLRLGPGLLVIAAACSVKIARCARSLFSRSLSCTASTRH